MILFARQLRDTGVESKYMETKGKEEGSGGTGRWDRHTHTVDHYYTVYKRENE